MHDPIILTGDRPTGKLHIGHYVGSLRQRVEAQHHYCQFVMIADLQALTDNGHNPAKVTNNVLEVMADYLAVGLDPATRRVYAQWKATIGADLVSKAEGAIAARK